MKNVLCFGDSLTWGFDAKNQNRHDYEDRWPVSLSTQLGDQVHVICEGLNGRTTAFNDYTADTDRNGARLLPTLLETHNPLDLVIIMLGTNDLKDIIVGTASSSICGMKRLISIIKYKEQNIGINKPDILIVAPPGICETANTSVGAMFSNGAAQSLMLAGMLSDLADETGSGFFDANSVAKTTPIDGIHMDAHNTRELGRGLTSTVKLMLGL